MTNKTLLTIAVVMMVAASAAGSGVEQSSLVRTFLQPPRNVATVVCPSGAYCPDYNTCCLARSGEYGCCPLPNAVCCADYQSCCPYGTTCDVYTRSCRS